MKLSPTKTGPMSIGDMPFRRCDGHGCGQYLAARGPRKHDGVDMNCHPGVVVTSPVYGTVTKLGYAYDDDLHWRFVEISDLGYKYRVFYVDPMVALGQQTTPLTPLGWVQRIADRHTGITPHIHFEIMNPDGAYIDPTPVVLAMRK